MQLRLAILLTAAALAGCAASNIGDDHILDSKRGSGVVAGTITYSGGYALYRLTVVNQQSNKSYRIEHGESQTLNFVYAFKGEPNNPDLQQTGSAFAIELPAGTYEVKSWQVSQGMANVWSTSPTGIQFTVEPGKAIYVGNFHFAETSRFVRAVTGVKVTLSDMAVRDTAVLTKSFPSLKATPITQSLASGTKIESVGGTSTGRISIPVFVAVPR